MRDFRRFKEQHPRSYEPWRPIDEAILGAMAGSSASVTEMADRLGRTETEIVDYLERTGRGRLLSDRSSA